MILKLKLKLFVLLFFFSIFSLYAVDFGLLLEGSAAREITDEWNFKGIITPWFSTPLGGNGDFYISAKAGLEFKGETFTFIPELMRTEFAYRWDTWGIRAGRIQYSDPLGFIADGLFDGAQVSFDIGQSSLGAGVWYTGFLYKKTANITMTEPELLANYTAFDFGDFLNTYFAPPRLLAAVDWEHPAIAELIRLKASLIGQFDFSGNENLYNSQYLALRAGVPVGRFVFDLGGCFQMAQAADLFQFSFAGEFGISWTPPLGIPNRLTLFGRFSGGTVDDTITAFVPITTVTQGNILKAKFSGLSMIRLEYTARLHESFSFNVQSSYFILSDLGTYQGLPAARDGFFLGDEVYASFVWSLFSDLQIRGGGGIFLPSLGNADPEGSLLWRAELSISFAIL